MFRGQTVFSLGVDANGAVWGICGDGSAFALKEGEVVYRFEPGMLDEADNYTIMVEGDTIYIGTGAGTTQGSKLLRLTLKDAQYSGESFVLESYPVTSMRAINTICRTEANELWIGSETGCGWFDETMTFREVKDIGSIDITQIIEDYEGSIWLASGKEGVYQITEGAFYHAGTASELGSYAVNAVAKLGDMMYVATDSGLLAADKNWNIVDTELTESLKGIRIRHVYVDSKGGLWIGTYSDLGLIRVSLDGRRTDWTESDGLLSNRIRQVLELSNGDFAVATSLGVNIIRDGAVAESYGTQEGMENPMILCLLETSQGAILAGSDGTGIYVIDGGEVSRIDKTNGLTAGVVLRMRADEEANGIWISAGNRLYFLEEGGKVREITSFTQGIGGIFDIQVTKQAVWLMKSNGLYRVMKEELLADTCEEVVEYSDKNGLSVDLNANAWNLYQDGRLYLSTTKGVYLFAEQESQQRHDPPKVVVNEVSWQSYQKKGALVSDGESIVIPKDVVRITISFASLSFLPDAGTISYYLEGFDEETAEVEADRAIPVSYTNLSGGTYRFHLSAKNADGVSGEEYILEIHKEYQIWEYAWFWVLLLGIVLLMLTVIVRSILTYKTKRVRQEREKYKEITEQALTTVARTIDAKDKYTNGHSIRVAEYTKELARRMNLSREEQDRMYRIALVHDIGKIGIPDAILNKKEKLTPEEYNVIKSHTRIGYEILKDFSSVKDIEIGALMHHEWYNGQGYPDGIAGEEIPLVARVICVADCYDAMATRRCYREAKDIEYIKNEFRSLSGIQFDPNVAERMLEMIEDGYRIAD